MPTVTIRDIARDAGVSTTTVSHVVNGTRIVSAAVKARVDASIENLGYVPNAAARSLRRNRTWSIGVVVPNCSNPFFAEMLAGVEDAAFAADISVILCNAHDDPQRQRRHLRLLTEKQVDAVLLLSVGEDERLAGQLLGLAVPHVVVDRDVAGLAVDSVRVDHAAGGRLAAVHLLDLGHRAIACITGPMALSSARQRHEGFVQEFERRGISLNDSMVCASDFTASGGYAAASRLLDSSNGPTAIFAANDLMAIGALRAVRECGLRLPDDLAVVGFDDIALASQSSPPLTTVAQPKAELGALAARVLIDRVARPDRSPVTHVLQPHLVVRESTSRAAEQ